MEHFHNVRLVEDDLHSGEHPQGHRRCLRRHLTSSHLGAGHAGDLVGQERGRGKLTRAEPLDYVIRRRFAEEDRRDGRRVNDGDGQGDLRGPRG